MSAPAMPIGYLLLKMIHFVALALGIGASFAAFTLRKAAAELDPAERAKFAVRALRVARNGSYGLLILLLSGLSMFFWRGVRATLAAGGGAFHAKLTLVVILCGLVGYSQALGKRAREAGGGPALSKLPALSNAILVIGVGIIICAVLAFQ